MNFNEHQARMLAEQRQREAEMKQRAYELEMKQGRHAQAPEGGEGSRVRARDGTSEALQEAGGARTTESSQEEARGLVAVLDW